MGHMGASSPRSCCSLPGGKVFSRNRAHVEDKRRMWDASAQLAAPAPQHGVGAAPHRCPTALPARPIPCGSGTRHHGKPPALRPATDPSFHWGVTQSQKAQEKNHPTRSCSCDCQGGKRPTCSKRLSNLRRGAGSLWSSVAFHTSRAQQLAGPGALCPLQQHRSGAIHTEGTGQGAVKARTTQSLTDGCTLWVNSAVPVCFTFT